MLQAQALINGIKINSNIPVVRLVFKNKSHVCTGVFIDANTILTAAHCIAEKEVWKDQSFELDSILDFKDNIIYVKQIKNIPHPQYNSHWYGNFHDIGIIKTSEYIFEEGYSKIFNLESGHSNAGIIYGCGIVESVSKTRKCLQGENSYFFLFNQIITLGSSKWTNRAGFDVVIASNDSGGPVIDKRTQEIIGINWGTLLTASSDSYLPNINFITSLLDTKNLEFIRQNYKYE